MLSRKPSPLSHFRYTLFYGPERDTVNPSVQYCVYNLKKRSWKGGVQVSVEISDDQIDRACRLMRFEEWLNGQLVTMKEHDRPHYVDLGQDVLVQQLCLVKLQVAIEHGIPQENMTLRWDQFDQEFDRRVLLNHEDAKHHILSELDLESSRASEQET